MGLDENVDLIELELANKDLEASYTSLMIHSGRDIKFLNEEVARLHASLRESRALVPSAALATKNYTVGLTEMLLIFQPNMVIEHIINGGFKKKPHFTVRLFYYLAPA